jgi:hypothetical protein
VSSYLIVYIFEKFHAMEKPLRSIIIHINLVNHIRCKMGCHASHIIIGISNINVVVYAINKICVLELKSGIFEF